MGYWRYARMPFEESLQQFEYFVSMDADAYFTQPVVQQQDPFVLMATNNLTGIYNIEAFQSGNIATGIQESAEAVFPLEERTNRYLSAPQYVMFDEAGRWRRNKRR